jgi:hypothetical protein
MEVILALCIKTKKMKIKLNLEVEVLNPGVSEEDFINIIKQNFPNCTIKDVSERNKSLSSRIEEIEDLINEFYEPCREYDIDDLRTATRIREELFELEKALNPKLRNWFTPNEIGIALSKLGVSSKFMRNKSIGHPYPTKF